MSTIKPANVLDPSPSGDICIPNISPRERRKRLTIGIVSFVLSLGVLAILIATGMSRWWRLPLFLLFAGATSGFFQWRDKTWVGLAARGSRQLGDEREKIKDLAELAQVRLQANKVQIKSMLVAMLLTLIAMLLPM